MVAVDHLLHQLDTSVNLAFAKGDIKIPNWVRQRTSNHFIWKPYKVLHALFLFVQQLLKAQELCQKKKLSLLEE